MFRIIGFPELLGRLLVVIAGAEHRVSKVPRCPGVSAYFHGQQPRGVHGGVFVGLGCERADLVPLGAIASVVEAYGVLGYQLTSRADVLAQQSQQREHERIPWGAALAAAHRAALQVSTVGADRRLGDRAVVASFDHLARHHGPSTRTPPAEAEDPPWLYRHGRPFSLLGHACALWGLTAIDVGELDGLGAVDVLERLGWQLSARATAVLASAQLYEAAGHTWGEIADMAATLHVSCETATEVDR